MTYQELKEIMCEEEAYRGHPDCMATNVEKYVNEPDVIEASENPCYRSGKGYVLPDGIYMFPGGVVEKIITQN